MDYEYLMETVILLGKKMLEDGAEISRVEDSLTRLLHHYKAEYNEVFGISSQITMSARFEGKTYTLMKKIGKYENNFYQLDEFNELCRYACSHEMPIEELAERYQAIVTEPRYPIWLTIIGSILTASGFAVFFGGGVLDAIFAGLLGILIVMSNEFIKPKINHLVHTLLITFLTGVIALCINFTGIIALDKVLIGTVMLLIPGAVLTNSIRDLFMGDIISGSLKFIESMLIAFCMALGYGLALFTFKDHTVFQPNNVSWWVYLLSGTAAAYGYAIIFHMKKKKLLLAGIGAVLGLCTYLGISALTEVVYVRFMVPTIVVCFYSEIMARVLKTPTICFITSGIMPLCPGGSLFYTISNLVAGNNDIFLDRLAITGFVVLGISSGVVISSVIFKYLFKYIHFIQNRYLKKEITE